MGTRRPLVSVSLTEMCFMLKTTYSRGTLDNMIKDANYVRTWVNITLQSKKTKQKLSVANKLIGSKYSFSDTVVELLWLFYPT